MFTTADHDAITNEYNFHYRSSEKKWREIMNKLSSKERVSQIILYLLCWGEANQVRFMPECLAFIFKCAYDFYSSGMESIEVKEVTDGYFLDTVITLIYTFLKNQVYEKVGNNNYIPCEKDHNDIIGYDDINQLFWYRQGLKRLVVPEGKNLLDFAPNLRYAHLKNVVWSKAFFKAYRETRSWLHMALNFNRIWIIHISAFWYYTCFNSPSLYTVNYQYTKNNQPPTHLRLSMVSLGGAVAPIINLIATLAEYMFVPRRWPGAQNLLPRLLILLVILSLCVGPTI